MNLAGVVWPDWLLLPIGVGLFVVALWIVALSVIVVHEAAHLCVARWVSAEAVRFHRQGARFWHSHVSARFPVGAHLREACFFGAGALANAGVALAAAPFASSTSELGIVCGVTTLLHGGFALLNLAPLSPRHDGHQLWRAIWAGRGATPEGAATGATPSSRGGDVDDVAAGSQNGSSP